MTGERYTPLFPGTINKIVFVDSPTITPYDLVIRAYEISRTVTIKETCFGAMVNGDPDEVHRVVKALRELDPGHIFVKDRAFPPGDIRRCRGARGGARPGFHGHEFEMERISYIAHGLETLSATPRRPAPTHGRSMVTIPHKLDAADLQELIDTEEE
ncbi:MAG: methanogenesis marker 6 protein [Methanoculleaceae archaeon]